MHSARVATDRPMINRRLALIGSFVSRLITFFLLYFGPALAHDLGPPGPAFEQAVVANEGTESPGVETLDPKHQKDHDVDRMTQRGHGDHLWVA